MRVAYISSKQRVLGLFSGLALLTFGIIIELKFRVYLGFFPVPINPVSILMMTLGGVVFLVGFFGCCAADKRNYYLSTAFAWVLVFVLVAEIGAVVVTYIFHRPVKSLIVRELRSAMNNYSDSERKRLAWDSVQLQFECCGVQGPQDWLGIYGQNNSLPLTCCTVASDLDTEEDLNQSENSLQNDQSEESLHLSQSENSLHSHTVCGYRENSTDSYNMGCVQSVIDWADNNELVILCVGAGIALVQIVGILLTFSLAVNIRMESGMAQKDDWDDNA